MAKGETLRKWRKANQYRLAIDFNRNSDSDKPLIDRLESQDNKAQYVKNLIRHDLNGEEPEK